MRDISYEVYMGKTIICLIFAMNTIIIVLYLCMVTACTCICTGASKNSRRSSTVYSMCRRNLVLYGRTLFWSRVFITCSISALPCHAPWSYMLGNYLYVLNYLAGPLLHVRIIILYYAHLATNFTLNFGVSSYIATCSYTPVHV